MLSKKSLDLDKFKSIKFSREIDGLKIYKMKCSNNYESVIELLDLIVEGVSIDSEIVDRVMKIVKENMKSGNKFLL